MSIYNMCLCMSLIVNGIENVENLQQKHEANGRRITIEIQIVPWEIERENLQYRFQFNWDIHI